MYERIGGKSRRGKGTDRQRRLTKSDVAETVAGYVVVRAQYVLMTEPLFPANIQASSFGGSSHSAAL
jgi:hypothetical protein